MNILRPRVHDYKIFLHKSSFGQNKTLESGQENLKRWKIKASIEIIFIPDTIMPEARISVFRYTKSVS
jgi:hypothetical protein